MAASRLVPEAYGAVAKLDRRVSESGIFWGQERAALGLTEAVTLVSETRVPDEVWSEAQRAFGERELANVLMAAVAINAWNRIAMATRMAPRNATG